jgi:deoxyhypusine synthase
MGLKINNKECILSWAAWNDVPVTVPAFTDGFIGEILYEYNKQHPGLIIDCVRDVFEFTKSVQWAKRTAALIFGAGVVKHHIMNANLKRNGVEYAVS